MIIVRFMGVNNVRVKFLSRDLWSIKFSPILSQVLANQNLFTKKKTLRDFGQKQKKKTKKNVVTQA